MTKHLKNTIVNYDRRTVGNYSVADYTSKNIGKMREYIKACDSSMFDWYHMTNNDKLERVALEIYGNPDYWDILLMINDRNPLFQFPFDFDTLTSLTTDKMSEYANDVYGTALKAAVYTEMYSKYEKEAVDNNELYRLILIVKPPRIYEFLQDGYEQGYF